MKIIGLCLSVFFGAVATMAHPGIMLALILREAWKCHKARAAEGRQVQEFYRAMTCAGNS